MKWLWLALLLPLEILIAEPQTGSPQAVPVVNVNERYQVEGIEVSGEGGFSLTQGVQDEIHRLVGARLDYVALDRLAKRIRTELHARAVKQRIERGTLPEHVRVVFEVERRTVEFNVSVPRFLYRSRGGWTGEAEASLTYAGNLFAFGLESDGDQLPERNSGVYARYGRRLGSDRVQAGVRFESFRQQWPAATKEYVDLHPDMPGLYRTRQNVQPTVVFLISRPLSVEAGLSFEEIESQFPDERTEAVHSLVTNVRFHRQWEGTDARQVLDAGYSLRGSARSLESDYGYTKHTFQATYSYGWGHQEISTAFLGGVIAGDAPLFDRYVLGSSTTLRGWNKLEVAPAGGNRVAHGSVQYRVRMLELFYDTGCVWDRRTDRTVRHSAGIGVKMDWLVSGLSMVVAFPLREGRIEPIFMAGMNF
jgi:Omp85 superfamily domain